MLERVARAPYPFQDLPAKHYGLIAADPPWKYLVRSPKGEGRSASQHYNCMTLADIKALPVAELAADDCVLLFWVTDPFLEKGFEIINAWGFKYSTVGFEWTKLQKNFSAEKWLARLLHEGDVFAALQRAFFMGMGHWSRANPEICLLATRGAPKRISKGVRQLIIEPRREHSRKPDQFLPRAEALVAGPRLEMFSRTNRPGWDVWGNEAGKFG